MCSSERSTWKLMRRSSSMPLETRSPRAWLQLKTWSGKFTPLTLCLLNHTTFALTEKSRFRVFVVSRNKTLLIFSLALMVTLYEWFLAVMGACNEICTWFHLLTSFSLVYRNNYASFQEIKTKTITVQASNNRGDSKKAKLFITLKRSPEFFENMKRFNEIREENEKKATTLAEERKASQWVSFL